MYILIIRSDIQHVGLEKMISKHATLAVVHSKYIYLKIVLKSIVLIRENLLYISSLYKIHQILTWYNCAICVIVWLSSAIL